MKDLIQFDPFKKLFTGPPTDKDHISYSGLCEIKRILTSGAPFLGDERFLHFGSEIHLRFLKNKRTKFKFTKEEELQLKAMLNSLRKHRFVTKLMTGSVKEVTEIVSVEKTRFKMIGDIVNERKDYGADLKSTSARSESEFISLAIKKYGYLGQGWCYKTGKQLKNFYFIGIQKKSPFDVYILDVNNFKDEEAKAIKETRFLLEFYRTYGRSSIKSSQASQPKK